MSGATRRSPWETMQAYDGSVLQAGVPSRPSNQYQDASTVQGWITRAVVLSVRYPEEDDRKGVGGKQVNVLCDVRTYGRYSRVLRNVPLLQRATGLHDQSVYIPRPSSMNITGGDLKSGSAALGPVGDSGPTPAEQLDGDHVLVGFLDNDPKQPVILPFTLGHPFAARKVDKATGRLRRVRHAGTSIEWSKEGDLLIDATTACPQELGPKGVEVPRVAGQKITVTTGTQKVEIVKGARVKITSGSSMIDATSTKITTQAAALEIFGLGSAPGTVNIQAPNGSCYMVGANGVVLGDSDSTFRGTLIKAVPNSSMDLGWTGAASSWKSLGLLITNTTLPAIQALAAHPVLGPLATPLVAFMLALDPAAGDVQVGAEGLSGDGRCEKVFGV
jgi:hypothetical protein